MSNTNAVPVSVPEDPEILKEASSQETLSYIAAMVSELEKLSRKKNYTTLAGILALAHYETERQNILEAAREVNQQTG